MKPRITIRLFGRFALHCNGQELLLHTSLKAKEILCYLAVNRRAAIPRDRLAAIISSERSADQAAKDLRHALWQLRSDLCRSSQHGADRILRIDDKWAQFVTDDSVSLDVDEFELATKDAPRHARAVGLYVDELLCGWDQEWCTGERERLRQIYLETLDSLTETCEAQRDIKSGVAYAMLALSNDSSRECTHRALMRLYYAAGDRHSALMQYDRCCAALRQELGIEPDDETKELERQVRAGHALGTPLRRSRPLPETARHGARSQSGSGR